MASTSQEKLLHGTLHATSGRATGKPAPAPRNHEKGLTQSLPRKGGASPGKQNRTRRMHSNSRKSRHKIAHSQNNRNHVGQADHKNITEEWHNASHVSMSGGVETNDLRMVAGRAHIKNIRKK